jgi:hypothetical protein
MNNHDDLIRLMEAVEPREVDQPKNSYANTPEEQYLDSATQQNFGDDLHKVKPAQYKQRAGDNPRSAEALKEEKRLAAQFKAFKINEGAMEWSSTKELARLVDDAIKDQGNDLSSTVTRAMFKQSMDFLLDGNVPSAVDVIMSEFSDHNGGERRDHDAYADDLTDELNAILASCAIEKSDGAATY